MICAAHQVTLLSAWGPWPVPALKGAQTDQRLQRGVDFNSNVHDHSCLFPSEKSKNQSKVFQPRLLVPLKVNLKFPYIWKYSYFVGFFSWLKVMVTLNELNPLPSFSEHF